MSSQITEPFSLKSLCFQALAEQNPFGSPACYSVISPDPTLELKAELHTQFLTDQWNRLKVEAPVGPINFPKVISKIEKKHFGFIGANNVNLLFYDLIRSLQPEYKRAGILYEDKIITDPADFVSLQTKLNILEENQALEHIWNQRLLSVFQLNGAFAPGELIPNRHAAIRAWLNDPAHAEQIFNVRQLNLSNLSLKVLPREIGLFQGVQRLVLSGNNLRYLPESLGNLVALTELGLNDNRLASLPESFGNLVALTKLGLHNNRLTSLPESFGNLVALTKLELHNNHLTSLPEFFGNLLALRELWLNDNRLASLPESFGNLVALTKLGLHNNRLASLPESFGNLVALTQLRLDDNHLASLPESFGNLVALTGLGLHNNHLTSLPESFGNLVALTGLRLYNNHLASLPESFGNLVALRELVLHNNHLTSLPESFGNLVALTGLGLDNNHLTFLPESIGNLVALKELWLHNNRLTSLPESFGNLSARTQVFTIQGNPLLFISDKELKKKPSLFWLLNYQWRFLTSSSKTILGSLFRTFLCHDAPGSQMLFNYLPEVVKSNIASRLNQVKDDFDLSADLGKVARVVRQYVYEGFDSLDEMDKNAVYHAIAEIAGHEGDLEWGKEHTFDDVSHFLDAYAACVFKSTSEDASRPSKRPKDASEDDSRPSKRRKI